MHMHMHMHNILYEFSRFMLHFYSFFSFNGCDSRRVATFSCCVCRVVMPVIVRCFYCYINKL